MVGEFPYNVRPTVKSTKDGVDKVNSSTLGVIGLAGPTRPPIAGPSDESRPPYVRYGSLGG